MKNKIEIKYNDEKSGIPRRPCVILFSRVSHRNLTLKMELEEGFVGVPRGDEFSTHI